MIKLYFLLSFLPLLCYSHEDAYHLVEYGNVTVRFKTGHYYEEVENAKIIGQYADLLCRKLDYNNQVVLDFVHDYGHSYYGKTFSYASYGKEHFISESYYREDSSSEYYGKTLHPVPYRDAIKQSGNEIIKETYESPSIDENDKIVIRQFGFHFVIKETLNLLHYAITNHNTLKRQTKSDTLVSYRNNMYYLIPTIPHSAIYSALHKSPLEVTEVISRRIYASTDSIEYSSEYYSYFSANNKYYVFFGIHGKEIIMDTLDRVYSFYAFTAFPQCLFVFQSPSQMKYYSSGMFDTDYKRSSLHDLPIDDFEYLAGIEIEWLGNDIYLIDYYKSAILINPFKRYIYLEKEDALIMDFDLYIDSHRKQNK